MQFYKKEKVMKKRKLLPILLALAMVLTMIPASVFANENSNADTIDFAEFVTAVTEGNGVYDGKGITVKWSPSSACTDNRDNHNCLLDGEVTKTPDGNNAQRIQNPNAQYQIFATLTNVKISNVNFEFEPADFTLCMNSTWGGTATANDVRNAELQMQNSGNVTFTDCTFNKIVLSPYGKGNNGNNTDRTLTVTGCEFNEVYDAYALKDIYPANASITGNSFNNCGGGIYFEGNSQKKSITITDNIFTGMDEYAAEGKADTRGLIQFSASGDYSDAEINITDNTSTGDAAVLRQLNETFVASVLDFDTLMEENSFAGDVLTDSTFGDNTVYYNGATYETLQEALTAVYMSSPASTAKIYCKAGADVGSMTHGHVADDIIIYGNGAYVSGGEKDIEIDTYKYDRSTGKQSANGDFLTDDITVEVYDLNGIAAWGQRNTDHTINLTFENCQNMQRVYFTNTANDEGKINITLNGCSFDADQGSNANTAVYSNAAGDISIKDTNFKGISVGLNINHKSDGTQNITLENCIFEDCALSDSPQAAGTKTYAAPVRVVARDGATTNIIVTDCSFLYSEGKENCGNGDILIGDGRYDAAVKQGTVTLAMTGTKADIMVQESGYYEDATGSNTDESKGKVTSAGENDTVIADNNNHFIIDNHESTKLIGKKDATCTAEGYTGDLVCTVCGKVMEKGQVIAKLAHDYENGKCIMCGAADPDYKPDSSAQTGDDFNMAIPFAAAGLALAAMAAVVATRKRHN